MADERVRQISEDGHVLSAISATTGEIREVHCDDNGNIIFTPLAGSLVIETGGTPTQINGTCSNATTGTVTCSATSTSILIVNPDTALYLYVELDGSGVTTTVPPESSLSGEIRVNVIEITSNAAPPATCAWQAIYTTV